MSIEGSGRQDQFCARYLLKEPTPRNALLAGVGYVQTMRRARFYIFILGLTLLPQVLAASDLVRDADRLRDEVSRFSSHVRAA